MFGYLHCVGNYVYVEKQVDQEEGTINYLMKIDRKTLKKVKEIKVNHSEDESVFSIQMIKISIFLQEIQIKSCIRWI